MREPLTVKEKVLWTLITLVGLTIWLLAAQTEKADAAEHLEEGATFNGGICWEADGTQGLAVPDGQCITPADYDIMFGYDNLSTVPTQYPFDGDTSVAEAAGIIRDSIPASIKPRSFMGESLPSFAEVILKAFSSAMF